MTNLSRITVTIDKVTHKELRLSAVEDELTLGDIIRTLFAEYLNNAEFHAQVVEAARRQRDARRTR